MKFIIDKNYILYIELYIVYKKYTRILKEFFKRNFLNKRFHIKMSQCFSKSFRSFGGNINVKVDLSNYATKTHLKNLTHVDTSSFVLKKIELI